MNFKDFTKNVSKWAWDRNLIKGGTLEGQYNKLLEEVLELGDATLEDEILLDDAKDAIGDITVVVTIFCEMLGVDYNECLQLAWDEIKDRKGKVVDGVFVKEELTK